MLEQLRDAFAAFRLGALQSPCQIRYVIDKSVNFDLGPLLCHFFGGTRLGLFRASPAESAKTLSLTLAVKKISGSCRNAAFI